MKTTSPPSLHEQTDLAFGKHLTFDHFAQMEELEATYYSHDFITPASEAFRWYEQHPRSTLAAFAEGNLAGFVNLLPVRGTVLESLLAGTFNDADLTADDIPAFESLAESGAEPFALFLSCIVVSAEQRGTGLSRTLLREALKLYTPPARNDTLVITDNVTAAGARFSERLGFAFVATTHHGSRLYTTELGNLMVKLDKAHD